MTLSGPGHFWLLASPLGRACSLNEVQRTVEEMETFRDMNKSREKLAQSSQPVRKAFSILRQALQEAGADDQVLIVRGGDADNPEYAMGLYHGKKH